MKPRVGDSEDETGTVILEGNLDVNQGAGWSALFSLSGRRLSSVDLQHRALGPGELGRCGE